MSCSIDFIIGLCYGQVLYICLLKGTWICISWLVLVLSMWFGSGFGFIYLRWVESGYSVYGLFLVRGFLLFHFGVLDCLFVGRGGVEFPFPFFCAVYNDALASLRITNIDY